MNTTSNLLTVTAEAEVSEALLRLALENYADTEAVETTSALPPVAPESVVYRRGELVIEPLPSSPGGALASQRIDVWIPAGTEGNHRKLSERNGRGEYATEALSGPHARLGKIERNVRQAVLSDDTTVTSGTVSVAVFPSLPLIEGRSAEVARSVLSDRHRGREVGKVGPVEGEPGHRTQRVEMGVVVIGSVHFVLDELRGQNTAAGRITGVEVLGARADHIGSGSFVTATPSHDRNAVQLAITLQWRER